MPIITCGAGAPKVYVQPYRFAIVNTSGAGAVPVNAIDVRVEVVGTNYRICVMLLGADGQPYLTSLNRSTPFVGGDQSWVFVNVFQKCF
ncbi:hypothetical protein [Thermosulfurimonas sp. F29]|uniref:hypothetical protein n=1 Tax=Thermosulfurimonas sp. F29 TaxID=2867247 RepID=UPI001C836BE1|nr:hypothetical protein [Thermosulfurimonas sp. F29]MBX6424181.1 hypothetical protein [Thermosulfurimonas sp. F29]